MRLAIVHYHLRKGGVTKVISSTLEALGKDLEQAVVISSTPPEEPLPCPVEIVPELAYTTDSSLDKAKGLHKALLKAARKHLGSDPDLWHIHNHCLGKNVNFPDALRMLLENGQRALLQIHDFSEDGRPGNFAAQSKPYQDGIFDDFNQSLFPVAPQIGYAVLNGRDRDILKRAGVPDSRVYWLPNAVTPPAVEGKAPERVPGKAKSPFYFYPTRAIRRKNLGEILLIASCLESGKLATSLTPKNPKWIPIHDAWRTLARELRLPVEFGLGEMTGNSFSGLIASSTALISTSVGEGFGLAFLEPWLLGKPIIGRDLPEVTSDFKNNGIQMPGLYEAWNIPADLVDLVALRDRFRDTLRKVYKSYQKSITQSFINDAFDSHVVDQMIDFGFLDELAQTEVLRNLYSRNIRLPLPISLEKISDSEIETNRIRIESEYGLSHYKSQLNSIYTELLSAEPGPMTSADPAVILESFLNPKRFSFLLT